MTRLPVKVGVFFCEFSKSLYIFVVIKCFEMLKSRRIINIICLLLLVVSGLSAKQRAFLVGVSDYSMDPRWHDIHGAEDVELLSGKLKETGFVDIKSLVNKEATRVNILKEWRSFVNQLKKGDVAYVHFSLHGQPFEDYDGDEVDGWDESLVPYDAAFMYDKAKYHGENHIIDDTIGVYVEKMREKVGPSGFVYIVLDACHSGAGSRGGDVVTRGTNYGFSSTEKKFDAKESRTRNKVESYLLSTSSGMSSVLVISACKSHQTNKEVEVLSGDKTFNYGSLSYYIAEALNKGARFKSSKESAVSIYKQVKEGMGNDWSLRNQSIDYNCSFEIK